MAKATSGPPSAYASGITESASEASTAPAANADSMPSDCSDATPAATLPTTRATASSAAVSPHTEKDASGGKSALAQLGRAAECLREVRGDDRGEERVRAALGEPDTQSEVLRDAVERDRRDEGETDGGRARMPLEQEIHRNECRGADQESSGRASKPRLLVRRLEQLERHRNDQRARREREQSSRQLPRRRPEAAERSAQEERSRGCSDVEGDFAHALRAARAPTVAPWMVGGSRRRGSPQ